MTSNRLAAVAAIVAAVTIGLPGGSSTHVLGAVQAPAENGRPTLRRFSGRESSSHYVTMRDGVRLAVDVHLPRGLRPGERTATILHMSRYYRSVEIRGLFRAFVGGHYPITERDLREEFVKAGYSWVDVEVRGSGASFGVYDYPLSPAEVRDGADLMDWITRQPWSAGVIGALGTSYDGSLATMLVSTGHPALKAVAPRFSAWDMYEDVFFIGGLKAVSMLQQWSRLTSALDRGRIGDIFGWTASLVAAGVFPVDAQLLPLARAERERNVDIEQLLGGLTFRDDPDPRGRPVTIDSFSPHTVAATSEVPVYVYGGWFDGALARGQIRQYLASTHPGSRMRMGPWFHGGEFNASPYARGRGEFDHAKELMRFFDQHLRGTDDGIGGEAPVQYYTMGDERWRSSSTWPPPGGATRSFFLSANRTLTPDRPTLPEQHDGYRVDATVTSGQGSRWGLIVGTGARRGYGDRRDRDRRLITYSTPPLAEDLEVTGHPAVQLYVSANAADAALFAYLEEVRPTGEVRYVTEGLLRLIHRQTRPYVPNSPHPLRTFLRAHSRPLEPDAVMEVVFDLLPTSFVFKAGTAIRLAIAGADAGTFDAPLPVNPLVYEIHRDATHPSRLDLPVYPRK